MTRILDRDGLSVVHYSWPQFRAAYHIQGTRTTEQLNELWGGPNQDDSARQDYEADDLGVTVTTSW